LGRGTSYAVVGKSDRLSVVQNLFLTPLFIGYGIAGSRAAAIDFEVKAGDMQHMTRQEIEQKMDELARSTSAIIGSSPIQTVQCGN
jgi:hypothetical protein